MAFRNVKVYHGLCTAFHSLEHKPQKLCGLINRLQKLGFRVELSEVSYIDYCMLEMCGHERMEASQIENFPSMTEEDIILLALGTYQLKLARPYCAEHLSNGLYIIETYRDGALEDLPDYGIHEDAWLLRGRIQSRHVFRCNLKHLKFSTHYTRDVVAQQAIAAVLETSARFRIARTFLWFNTLMYDEMSSRGPYTPKNYWPEDVEVKPYTTCNECVACCDILVTRQEMKSATPSRCFGFHVCLSEDKLEE